MCTYIYKYFPSPTRFYSINCHIVPPSSFCHILWPFAVFSWSFSYMYIYETYTYACRSKPKLKYIDSIAPLERAGNYFEVRERERTMKSLFSCLSVCGAKSAVLVVIFFVGSIVVLANGCFGLRPHQCKNSFYRIFLLLQLIIHVWLNMYINF